MKSRESSNIEKQSLIPGSIDTYKLVVDFFVALSDGETQSEQLRLALNQCDDFDPYLLFNRLDQYRRGYLTEDNLIEFAKLHEIEATINQGKFLLLFYDTDCSRTLTYTEFLNLVLCKDFYQLKHNSSNQISKNESESNYISYETEKKFCELLQCEFNLIKEIDEILAQIKSYGDFSLITLISQLGNSGNFINLPQFEDYFQKNNANVPKENIVSLIKRLDLKKNGRIDLSNLEKVFYFPYSSPPSRDRSHSNSILIDKKEEQIISSSPLDANVEHSQECSRIIENSKPQIQYKKRPHEIKNVNNKYKYERSGMKSTLEYTYKPEYNINLVNKNPKMLNYKEIENENTKAPNDYNYKPYYNINLTNKKEKQFNYKDITNNNMNYPYGSNLYYQNNNADNIQNINSISYPKYKKEITINERNYNQYKSIPIRENNFIFNNQNSNIKVYESRKVTDTLSLRLSPKRKTYNYNSFNTNISSSNYQQHSMLLQREQVFTEGQLVSFVKFLMDVEKESENRKIEILCKQADFNIEDLFILFETPSTKNDFLTFNDFKQGLTKLDLSLSDDDIKILLTRFDLDKEGGISYSNFFDMLVPYDKENRLLIENREGKGNLNRTTLNLVKSFILFLLESEKKIENYRVKLNNLKGFNIQKIYFEQIDQFGRGFVSNDDLESYLKRKGVSFEHNDVDLLFIRFDLNRDGKLSYDNFINEVTPIIG